jgi:hypothetical protein
MKLQLKYDLLQRQIAKANHRCVGNAKPKEGVGESELEPISTSAAMFFGQ